MLGWLNWNRGRRDTHRMDVLDQLLVDMHAQTPDHIALTGDVVNLALPGEYPAARAFLERVGSPDQLSSCRATTTPTPRAAPSGSCPSSIPGCGATGRRPPLDETERFPYVRIRGKVALVGLSSAIPTAPFMATGKLGVRQVARLRDALERLGKEGLLPRRDAAPSRCAARMPGRRRC